MIHLLLNIKGTLTSKRAMHVPVIRRWRLVWERREFGTKVDRINKTIPVKIDIGRGNDLGHGFSIHFNMATPNSHKATIEVRYMGMQVPGTRQVFDIPMLSQKRHFAWNTHLYKGVKVDVEAVISPAEVV